MKQEGLKELKKILLALDGSKISENTTSAAIQVAEMLSLDISGSYVIDEELVIDDYADYKKELGIDEPPSSREDRAALFGRRGHEVLEWFRSKCKECSLGMTIEIGMGGVPEMILNQAQEASLLAIGRRGNGHPDEPEYLGKNFRHIAHRVRLPLLVGGDSTRPIKRILLGYNGGERAQKALVWAKQLHDCGNVDLLALIVEGENEARLAGVWEEELKSQLSGAQIKDFRLITQKGNPPDEIIKEAMKNESDLIIMGGYRHKPLLEWLSGSTVDTVLRSTPLTLLIV